MSDHTPMMLQYRRIKSRHRDAVLFFRLGDFYEMFDSDARLVSRLLNLTLTSRHGVPMCGIPYHAAGNYIPRLLKAGKKIAICEQTSQPVKGKTIVDREVVEVITPGTVIDQNFLDGNRNNYIISIGCTGNYLSLVYLDLSTADFRLTAIEYIDRVENLKKELFSLNPSELIIQESLLEEDPLISRLISERPELLVNRFPDWKYDFENSFLRLTTQLGSVNLKAYGLNNRSPEIFAAGVLLEYIDDTSKNILPHIQSITTYSDLDFLSMDEATQKNLEILRNLHDNSDSFTLISILDKTKTTMGSRKLKKWLISPSRDLTEINNRHSAVDYFYHHQNLLDEVRNELKSVQDIERLSARIAMDKAHAKDMISLKNSIAHSMEITEKLKHLDQFSDKLQIRPATLKAIGVIYELIDISLCEEPSILLSEGGMIKDGYDNELDDLKKLKNNSQQFLKDYLESEKQNTGIMNLKVKYNRIIGHFLDVTKANAHLVPDYFIRRQALVGNERYTTEKLGVLESELNNSAEKIIALEKTIFLKIRDEVKKGVKELLEVSAYISEIDCFQSYAQAATENGYVRPLLNDSLQMDIIEGRHPVVEINLGPGKFVPNSISLGNKGKSFALITGPNMAGKSTYLRQVALITLMAQAGSFVPAESAVIGITDRIFCRVGASDNLARGESTFLVEMNETAFILRNATDKSLIIMDEVGRGTSTDDGLSIAWAVSEYLLTLGVKTLFATHYHELTKIVNDRLINLHLEVIENEGDIVFLKKVIEGASGNSYGLHVAKLAGIPGSVLLRAASILARIGEVKSSDSGSDLQDTADFQPYLFSQDDLIKSSIKSLDINRITPMDALHFLSDLKSDIESEG